jgi:hypothetical protein
VNADPDPALKMSADPYPDPGKTLKKYKMFKNKINVKY